MTVAAGVVEAVLTRRWLAGPGAAGRAAVTEPSDADRQALHDLLMQRTVHLHWMGCPDPCLLPAL
ncbi:hypothetical protein GCM10023147_28220 [Tsukamurella soli]|uniref:Uncharacterized protein n=1 Tax=Tsukamurella soli TaxID=644556 RepID=A0ABP8JRX2_9ACTN